MYLVTVSHSLKNRTKCFWSQRHVGSNYLPNYNFSKNLSPICLLSCCSSMESIVENIQSLLNFLFMSKTMSLNAYKTSLKCTSQRLCSKLTSTHDGLDPTDLCTWFLHIIHHGIFLTLSTPGRILRLLRDLGQYLTQILTYLWQRKCLFSESFLPR